MQKIKLLTLASLISLQSSAFAAVSMPVGWYLEGNLGKTDIGNTNVASGASQSNSGTGWNFNIGYKFIPFLAAEVGYTDYAKTTYTSQGTTVAGSYQHAYDAAAKAILPLSGSGFDVFGKFGVASLYANVTQQTPVAGITVNSGDQHATAMYYGLGMDYNLVPNVALVAQWQCASGNSETGRASLYSLGVNYMF